ncbi:hypothetical protein [Mucilaginibacter sp.]|uniref:hypothetical protein n=1 Tax=Mucilaginibacter sp. TaxID=1882438 RepID=UPI0026207D79|nr:hypothetical protein [Mucilaginibacter sp.]MDB4920450.1 hypothetical protein [Mucilaginibacter sp.]
MRSFFYKRRFLFIPLAVAAILSLVSFVVMNLWNYLLPGILHVGVITFWQAMGIFILCKILFGFGKGGGPGRGNWMRHRMEERFKNMTPDEREKFKEKMQNCGHGRWGRHGGHPYEKYWDDVKSEEKES